MGSWANAQEVVIDTPVEVAIEEVPAPELEQPVDIPLKQGGIVVQPDPTPIDVGPVVDDRDMKRLDIMAFQALSFESTGEYTQVKDMQVIEGDVIGFEASMVDVVEPTEEIHVYDAPCGKGWQLIVHDTQKGYVTASSGEAVLLQYPVTRSYGYGCEHTNRTYNW